MRPLRAQVDMLGLGTASKIALAFLIPTFWMASFLILQAPVVPVTGAEQSASLVGEPDTVLDPGTTPVVNTTRPTGGVTIGHPVVADLILVQPTKPPVATASTVVRGSIGPAGEPPPTLVPVQPALQQSLKKALPKQLQPQRTKKRFQPPKNTAPKGKPKVAIDRD